MIVSVIEYYFGLACDHGNYFALKSKKEMVLLGRDQNGFQCEDNNNNNLNNRVHAKKVKKI